MAGTRAFPDGVPTLVDGDVTLRAHRLSDVDDLVTEGADPVTVRWTTVPVPFGVEDAVSYVTRIVPAGWTEGTTLAFAVEAPHPDGTRRFGGSVSLRPRGDGVAELGFGLHPAVRGRGVARRAVRLLVDWAFDSQGVDVITWASAVGNFASRRVVWATGFSFDGRVAGLLAHRGERRDAWIGSLRATDDRTPKHPWHVPTVITSARLRLRPLVAEDADRLHELMFDERGRHFGGRVRAVRELRGGTELLQRAWDANARGERIDWAIADRETDLLVGHIQLFGFDGLDDSAVQTGYSVHPDSRGRGYLTEALAALTEWVFRPAAEGGLNRRRLSLTTAMSNTASRYGAERAGFVHIATEPAAFTIGESGFDDMAVYHRINPSWRPA